MRRLIYDLLYEKGQVSLTRFLALVGFLTFILGSFWLIYKGIKWENYETFATFTGGGGAATQIANKLINSKYNSNNGESYNKEKENA